MGNLAAKSPLHTATSLFSENWNILRGDLQTATTLLKRALGGLPGLEKQKRLVLEPRRTAI